MRANMVAWALAALTAFGAAAMGEVKTREVEYRHGDVALRGFLAWDDAKKGRRPGVLIVHEWWGHNEYARTRARMLAQMGYTALAVDMYGEGKTTKHPMEAGQMANAVRMNLENWRGRALAGLEVLKAQPQCDKSRIAAIGYCFGGSTVLQLALAGADLKAVASFHGALPRPTEAEAKQVKAAILVCHGADDSFIPEEVIKTFRGTLDKAGAKYDFVAYPGVRHSFTVPDADSHGIPGLKYDKKADEDSWRRLKELLAAKLGK